MDSDKEFPGHTGCIMHQLWLGCKCHHISPLTSANFPIYLLHLLPLTFILFSTGRHRIECFGGHWLSRQRAMHRMAHRFNLHSFFSTVQHMAVQKKATEAQPLGEYSDDGRDVQRRRWVDSIKVINTFIQKWLDYLWWIVD